MCEPELQPLDHNLVSVLGRPVELTPEFKRHYEVWLQQEVFAHAIDWDQLLTTQQLQQQRQHQQQQQQ